MGTVSAANARSWFDSTVFDAPALVRNQYVRFTRVALGPSALRAQSRRERAVAGAALPAPRRLRWGADSPRARGDQPRGSGRGASVAPGMDSPRRHTESLCA